MELQSLHIYTSEYSNHLAFAHKLGTETPSLGPYHWCAVSPLWASLSSSAPYCTWQCILWLVGIRSSSLPFPGVCQSQYWGSHIAHDWTATVGQRYAPVTTCTCVTDYSQQRCTTPLVCSQDLCYGHPLIDQCTYLWCPGEVSTPVITHMILPLQSGSDPVWLELEWSRLWHLPPTSVSLL